MAPRTRSDRWLTIAVLASNALTALAVLIVALTLGLGLVAVFAGAAVLLSALSTWLVIRFMRDGGHGPEEPAPVKPAAAKDWKVVG